VNLVNVGVQAWQAALLHDELMLVVDADHEQQPDRVEVTPQHAVQAVLDCRQRRLHHGHHAAYHCQQ
jgi:hypothetical protein